MATNQGYFNVGAGTGGGGGGGEPSSSGAVVVDTTFNAAEPISGGAAVGLTQSGTVQTAMGSVSGRMPAIGVVTSNYLSGANVAIWRAGKVNSTFWNFSGWAGRPLYVGASGDVVASGAPQASGNIQQIVGVSVNASGLDLQIGDPLENVVAASGDIGSGAVTGQAGGGYFGIASGSIGTNDIGSGAIQSGLFASGTLSTYKYGSGSVIMGAQFNVPVYSGTPWTMLTAETVSGLRAVSINQSGQVQIAMASVSGRMPAIGVVVDNVLSGIQANIYTGGVITPTSGLFVGISGFGTPVWVGRSGFLTTMSGWQGSGGWASGDLGQKLGFALALGSGGILLGVNSTFWSGGPLGEATGGIL